MAVSLCNVCTDGCTIAIVMLWIEFHPTSPFVASCNWNVNSSEGRLRPLDVNCIFRWRKLYEKLWKKQWKIEWKQQKDIFSWFSHYSAHEFTQVRPLLNWIINFRCTFILRALGFIWITFNLFYSHLFVRIIIRISDKLDFSDSRHCTTQSSTFFQQILTLRIPKCGRVEVDVKCESTTFQYWFCGLG